MTTVFHTKQFRAGNSQAVRLPAKLAYPPETKLTLTRIGERIIIEPTTETLNDFVDFLCSVGKHHDGQRIDLDIPARGSK
ncbi:hypothetical protein LJC71_07440 [Desulfosarcina sp. OttesenSCG-928-A07]|nr:hypothetical protein [Desulfosarcina sp. OttesenSCG-928-G17]MDL2329558.1 hypothetical protein [Desulfosarcina sp. OttesenSCG-928-A07]